MIFPDAFELGKKGHGGAYSRVHGFSGVLDRARLVKAKRCAVFKQLNRSFSQSSCTKLTFLRLQARGINYYGAWRSHWDRL